jgi:hypothetical protein
MHYALGLEKSTPTSPYCNKLPEAKHAVVRLYNVQKRILLMGTGSASVMLLGSKCLCISLTRPEQQYGPECTL